MLSLFQQLIYMTLLSPLEIQSYLPHRPPFLWVDQVLEVTLQQSIVAIKDIKSNEPFFNGHFPKVPIMPGVLIVESMAQAVYILANYRGFSQKKSAFESYVLAKVNSMQFKRSVFPGDQLCIKAQKKWARLSFLCYTTQAFVGDQLVCEGQITIAKKNMMNQKGTV